MWKAPPANKENVKIEAGALKSAARGLVCACERLA
ncbi:hypothetical protein M2321_000381 [Rhodoblastus acidophilus]|nr:hypothetical protein [Rhodoblastus acidophilus]